MPLRLFPYYELSESAKENAYEKWLAKMNKYDVYANHDELKIIVANLASVEIDIKWNIDIIRSLYQCEVMLPYNEAKLVGVRAAKAAMKAYYRLTNDKIAYVKHLADTLRGINRYTAINHDYATFYYQDSFVSFPNADHMITTTNAFTGHYLSEMVSEKFWELISETTSTTTYQQIVDNLAKYTFETVLDEHNNELTQNSFIQYYAEQFKYDRYGNIFKQNENCQLFW